MSETPPFKSRLESEGMEVRNLISNPGSDEDACETASVSREEAASWVALDGYHFEASYQRLIKESVAKLLVIDDNAHAEHYYSDLVLNQNLHALEDMYSRREKHTRLLLGPRYALLRREYRNRRPARRHIAERARRLLVTLGGSDPDNVTLKVIQALGQMSADELEAKIVLGAWNTHRQELCAEVSSFGPPMQILSDVSNMPELMAWADVAVTAGGTTCWELAYMGLPSLVVVLAENQRATAERLDGLGAALNLGWHSDIEVNQISQSIRDILNSPARRTEMSLNCMDFVDGEGAARVAARMSGYRIRLRAARHDDVHATWKWCNDDVVRAASFYSDPIPWREHEKWFRSKLTSPDCLLYILLDEDDKQIGQLRFDLQGGDTVVSISLDKECRGMGYGREALSLASRRLFSASTVSSIHAYVKPENAVSLRAFAEAGYHNVGRDLVRGSEALHLVFQKGVSVERSDHR
jgi:UDP-2,4-diacetamido-2,4,6-trideoxy-beta-L-altropyranose hydrolase